MSALLQELEVGVEEGMIWVVMKTVAMPVLPDETEVRIEATGVLEFSEFAEANGDCLEELEEEEDADVDNGDDEYDAMLLFPFPKVFTVGAVDGVDVPPTVA